MTRSGMLRRASAAAVATCAAVTLASCSSSGSTGTSTPPTTSAGTGSAGSGSSASGGSGDAAAISAIKDAYAKFFAPDTPEEVSLGLLQNGQKFKKTIEQQASNNSMAANSSAKVSTVTLLSPTLAKVSYTIFVNKQAMLKNQPGYAVKTDGTWQVSEFTFCGLLTLEGAAPAECKQPTATTTPS